jgi:hypothetical protein
MLTILLPVLPFVNEYFHPGQGRNPVSRNRPGPPLRIHAEAEKEDQKKEGGEQKAQGIQGQSVVEQGREDP